jgi:hypothetical protein
MQLGLDAAERVFVDDRRNLDFDPLRLWTRLACSAVITADIVELAQAVTSVAGASS